MPANRPSTLLPTASLLAGATLWGLVWYPMRLLEAGGLRGLWLVLVLYVAALTCGLAWGGSRLRAFSQLPGWSALLMLSAGWTNLAFVLAIVDGNVLRVLLLFYLSPLWAVLFGWWLLGERPSRAGLASLVVAMSGALLMLWNPTAGFPWPQDQTDWLALSSGLAFALSNVAVRKATVLSIAAKSVAAWLGVVLMSTALIAFVHPIAPAIETQVALGAVALGVFGIFTMTALVQYGVTHMPVHRSAVILLFELIVGALSQQLLTDETVTLREWVGGGLIVVGAYLAARVSK
jgi:drug/metabolite transporter (DMT)-like permease